jgi:hypothetical protein
MVSGCIVAVLWRRGIQYSKTATFLSIGVSAAICLASGAAVVWRAATDPLASQGANERAEHVVEALAKRDCAAARSALAATEAVAEPTPELEGLRSEVARVCPPGRP